MIPETIGLYVEGFSLWTKLVSFTGVMYKARASRKEFGNGKVDSMFSLFTKLRLNTESVAQVIVVGSLMVVISSENTKTLCITECN